MFAKNVFPCTKFTTISFGNTLNTQNCATLYCYPKVNADWQQFNSVPAVESDRKISKQTKSTKKPRFVNPWHRYTYLFMYAGMCMCACIEALNIISVAQHLCINRPLAEILKLLQILNSVPAYLVRRRIPANLHNWKIVYLERTIFVWGLIVPGRNVIRQRTYIYVFAIYLKFFFVY